MFKTLFLFLALAFTAPAAMAAPAHDTTESETMQFRLNAPNVPDEIRETFRDKVLEEFHFKHASLTTQEAKHIVHRELARQIADGHLKPGSEVSVQDLLVDGDTLINADLIEARDFDASFGALGYEAYFDFTFGKTFDGRDMPTWEALPQRIKDAWTAAARKIRTAHAASILA